MPAASGGGRLSFSWLCAAQWGHPSFSQPEPSSPAGPEGRENGLEKKPLRSSSCQQFFQSRCHSCSFTWQSLPGTEPPSPNPWRSRAALSWEDRATFPC